MKLLMAIKTFFEKDAEPVKIGDIKAFWSSCTDQDKVEYRATLTQQGYEIDPD